MKLYADSNALDSETSMKGPEALIDFYQTCCSFEIFIAALALDYLQQMIGNDSFEQPLVLMLPLILGLYYSRHRSEQLGFLS